MSLAGFVATSIIDLSWTYLRFANATVLVACFDCLRERIPLS